MQVLEGDLVEFDAEAAVGHEQRGRRPALVVSVDALQAALGLAVVCAVGNALHARNELEVLIPAELPVHGVILPHQIRTIDLAARRAEKLCSIPRATLLAVRARLKRLLGL